MCGIVGLVDTHQKDIPEALLHAMKSVMTNRGPDGSGTYIDGHVGMAMTRLSVIDLERGGQPLFSRDGRVVAFQNGEIYNYKELRSCLEPSGYRFRTSGDTEVLAHGYDCWGINGLLERIDGMYAMAILDRDERALYLARDRFGEKPLFYCCGDGRFSYGSDMRMLAALPWVESGLDPTAMERYLALHYVPGDRTIMSAIKRVLPGECLRIHVDRPDPKKWNYYDIPTSGGGRVGDNELADTIESSVRSRMVSDVPLGVFLSGGLDSSIVAAIASRASERIRTFSMGFHNRTHDESEAAKRVAEHIGSDHHHFLFDEGKFLELLPKVASALDEPVGDQALLPVFWLCREARQHVKVVLSGEGADEVFGGYGYYSAFSHRPTFRDYLSSFLGKNATGRGGERLRTLIDNDVPITPSGFPLLTNRQERGELLGISCGAKDAWEGQLFSLLNACRDPLQRAMCADLKSWLPDDLLVKYDRMAMVNSLEGRAPYLAPELVEMGLNRLPPRERVCGAAGKIALRRVARRWLPASILDRPKQGFVLPMGGWLKQWFVAQGGAREYWDARAVPGIDGERVAALTEREIATGVSRERLLFSLVLFAEWYDAFRNTVGGLRRECRAALGGA